MRGLKLFALAAAVVLGVSAILPSGTPAEASGPRPQWGTLVIANYSCSYGRVSVTLNWTGNSPDAYVQAVHLSYYDNGWRPWTYTSSDAISPYSNMLTWYELNPGQRHYMRVLEWYSDGSYDSSLTFRFDTPWCGADGFTPTWLSFVPQPGSALSPGYTTGEPQDAPATGSTLPYYANVFNLPGDYDCAGGIGDGPNYVQGPVRLAGADVYRLDANGNGIGCEQGDEGY
jgi:hypothetical protein